MKVDMHNLGHTSVHDWTSSYHWEDVLQHSKDAEITASVAVTVICNSLLLQLESSKTYSRGVTPTHSKDPLLFSVLGGIAKSKHFDRPIQCRHYTSGHRGHVMHCLFNNSSVGSRLSTQPPLTAAVNYRRVVWGVPRGHAHRRFV